MARDTSSKRSKAPKTNAKAAPKGRAERGARAGGGNFARSAVATTLTYLLIFIVVICLRASGELTQARERALNSAGTTRQDYRIYPAGSRGWTWSFPAGQLLDHVRIDGTTFNGSNTQDTSASVNGQTVIVTDPTGKAVKADMRYDAAIDQMQLLMREEPQVGKAYAVTITTGVKDLRGNPMAANYSWTFTISGVRQPAEQPSLYLPVVKR